MFGRQYATTYDVRELADEMEALEGQMVECPDCEGTGLKTVVDANDPTQESEIDCPKCEGEGEIRDETELDEADKDRLKDLRELAEQVCNDNTADALRYFGDNYEPTLVDESDFEQYAEQLADELSPFPADSEAGQALQTWPYRHIDWDAAAAELRHDYTSVEFEGKTWLMRSV